MKAQASPLSADKNDEVVALIQALHTAEQRLEELTAGEVDTVADRGGRTLMLRRAQDRVRHNAAAKQAAILNALPAHIALLDGRGVIVSVNETWRCGGGAQLLGGPGHGIGINYLDVCESAADQGRQVAEGIRSVLLGVAGVFSVEYARSSPTEQRLFQLTVTPLGDDRPSGAVVMCLDVTAEKLSEHTLRVSELRFRQMAESIRDVFFLRSTDSAHIFYVSPAYESIWGRTCESLYLNPASWLESIHPEDREQALREFIETEKSDFNMEFRIVRPDGEVRWINARGAPILDDAGQPYRTAGVISDITERKQAEIKIKRLNRVYAVLSQIAALAVRVQDRDQLFREACRVAVEAGAFKVAWIGVVDPETLDGKVVAWYGCKEDYVKQINLTAREGTEVSERPACRALRLAEPVICNDVATEPSLAELRDELLARGQRSLGCFPLTVAGRPDAVLALFAAESQVFDPEEMRLLLETAGNISFALDHVEKRERLDYLAYYDELTGLANRSLFLERVAQHMRSARGGAHKLALGLIDLERFKNINLSLGRPVGDLLLQQVAHWLTLNLGDASLLARVGADHFAVVFPEVSSESELEKRVGQSMDALKRHPFILNEATFHIAAKIGVALFPDDADDADNLFKNAEAALRKAKAAGDRFLLYAQKMTTTVVSRLNLETQLRDAIAREEFVLHYQPKVSLFNGKLTGAEALIRWNDPRSGLVPPAKFIPILEDTGLIHEVGRWALQRAIDDYLRWRAAGLPAPRVAVNVSALQLRSRGFIDELRHAIEADTAAAAGLELEITESLIMEDVRHSAATLKAIQAMGISIAIDDFGTGFSSLSYLSKLPVDTLKIDRSFVNDMVDGQQGLLLVSTIINLAHSLKLKVVAEGVETAQQSSLLQTLGCDEMQGYLFSKPVPGEIFQARYLTALSAA